MSDRGKGAAGRPRGSVFGRHLHGRRKGHPLSPRRRRLVAERLPALRLDLAAPTPLIPKEPESHSYTHQLAQRISGLGKEHRSKADTYGITRLFPLGADDVWLEIGFGGGEHLAWQAAAHPNIGFIGCEPFINGVARLLAEIEERGLVNLRIHDGDARDVLDWLLPASIGRVFILFPDPWPKKRHHKRRLVTTLGVLDQLARVMRPGAELRLATDIEDYAHSILEALVAHAGFEWPVRGPRDWRERAADRPPTRYEAKAAAAGRRCYYFTFCRSSIARSAGCLGAQGRGARSGD